MPSRNKAMKNTASVRRSAPLGMMLPTGVLVLMIFCAPFVWAGQSAKDAAAHKSASSAVAVQDSVLQGLPISQLSETEAILHALNRLTYGPRPGDVENVRKMGLANWINQQLNPDSIDDSAVQARLGNFQTLTMTSAKLMNEFPQPQQAAKREGVTLQQYQQEQQQKQQALNQQMNSALTGQGQNGDAEDASMSAGGAGGGGGKGGKRNGNDVDPNKALDAYEKTMTPQRIVGELQMAKMDRAIYSERQLYEVMAAFWFNHFNVFAGKGQDRWMLTAYERDTIRPNALGKFDDLVVATAKSPAMLFYLDNWLNTDPNSQLKMAAAGRGGGLLAMRPPGQQARQFGINENYGRELMELHTLGVDGGYTQEDVQEVAKCFTGWTIRQPRQQPEFMFNPAFHVDGPKTVLGHTINAGGMNDGLAVIRLLTHDPHTAHHISLQLAQHFVSDNPPPALVDRMAQTFLTSDGDIKAVLHTMFYSPEFWSREVYAAKVKTPFELVVSAARAVGAQVDMPLPMVMWTARIGEPLYQCQPPTGYKDTADAWVNTGALLNRLNYSLTLTGNRLRGSRVDLTALIGTDSMHDPHDALERSISVLLNGDVSAGTRSTLEKQLDNPQILNASLDDPVKMVNGGMVAGLVLGAPEFQRR